MRNEREEGRGEGEEVRLGDEIKDEKRELQERKKRDTISEH